MKPYTPSRGMSSLWPNSAVYPPVASKPSQVREIKFAQEGTEIKEQWTWKMGRVKPLPFRHVFGLAVAKDPRCVFGDHEHVQIVCPVNGVTLIHERTNAKASHPQAGFLDDLPPGTIYDALVFQKMTARR